MLPCDPPTPQTDLAIPSHYPSDLATLLRQFSVVFATPPSLPPPRPHDHSIHLLPNSSSIKFRPYRYPHCQKEAMATLINGMLRDGLILPSTSPYSSPVILVKKKDGTWRFCTDYHTLNSITVRDRFPIPTIDKLLDELRGTCYYSKIDLHLGYHQIRLSPGDIHKTAFRTMDGHYEFLVMPFGPTNAPSTFQAAMNNLLRPFLRRFLQSSQNAPLGCSRWITLCTTAATVAFEALRQAMALLPALALPDFNETFNVTTDASSCAVGAVLSQQGRPLVLFSKKLIGRMRASSTYIRELYAITEAVKKMASISVGVVSADFISRLREFLSQLRLTDPAPTIFADPSLTWREGLPYRGQRLYVSRTPN
ncbi:UNVERIFIED_CONTAM: Transposon Ty3-G Gag-Pol polyprotein [Sesamum radiatum]|uniref:Transposon Ty3-G Gag-Pol polyprotein n=1 Tax=Sesamum radiatum TaxID=300843 RepID=A0AAW2W1F2_SESRA